jgi:hypothetical protein
MSGVRGYFENEGACRGFVAAVPNISPVDFFFPGVMYANIVTIVTP